MPDTAVKNIDDEDRVFRGGSWYYDSSYCRASFRRGFTPDNRCDLGFRVVGFRVLHRRKP